MSVSQNPRVYYEGFSHCVPVPRKGCLYRIRHALATVLPETLLHYEQLQCLCRRFVGRIFKGLCEEVNVGPGVLFLSLFACTLPDTFCEELLALLDVPFIRVQCFFCPPIFLPVRRIYFPHFINTHRP